MLMPMSPLYVQVASLASGMAVMYYSVVMCLSTI